MIRKAVIPAAGLGTRFLPATKAVPKELIPVVDRPVIQYAVEEAVRAGAEHVCIVISKGKESIEDHFLPNPELEAALSKPGKEELLASIRGVSALAQISTVYQDEPLGLGHAVGVARDAIGDEPFMVLLPDEIYDPADDFMARMVAASEESGVSVVAGTDVSDDEIALYGAVDADDLTVDLVDAKSVVEKPAPGTAPSNLALVGRYVLVPEIFDILDDVPPGSGGEIQLTDALGVLAGRGELRVMRYHGRRWDAGRKDTYLEAVVELGLRDPELGPGFSAFLEKIVAKQGE